MTLRFFVTVLLAAIPLRGLTATVIAEPAGVTLASHEASPPASLAPDEHAKSLTIATWGGAYGRSQEIAFANPFSEKTGITVALVSHKGSFAGLGSPGQSPQWDLVDIGSAELERACAAGHLVRFGIQELADAGAEGLSREDFRQGAFHDCGIASVAWSAVIVYNREAYAKKAPAGPKDFFDVEKFPGRRALPRGPRYTLELALLADGAAPEEIYQLLDTDAGVTRAFSMLDKIRSEIVWWDRGYEPVKKLADQTVTQALAFNGRVFQAIARDNLPLAIVWSGQIYDLDYWAIPKGTTTKQTALKFIAFATQAERLADQARWFPYGPMRRSALSAIGNHPEADVAMAPFVPTMDEHMEQALRINATWWEKNEERLSARLAAWRVATTMDREGGDHDALEVERAATKLVAPKKARKKPRPRRKRRR